MTEDKPLTEKDIVNTPEELGIVPFVWVEKVQSAKRLLKAQLQDRLYPADADDIVDACFQIDDKEAAKPGRYGGNTQTKSSNKGFCSDKPGRKSLKTIKKNWQDILPLDKGKE